MKLEPEDLETGGWGDDDELVIDEGTSLVSTDRHIDCLSPSVSVCLQKVPLWRGVEMVDWRESWREMKGRDGKWEMMNWSFLLIL